MNEKRNRTKELYILPSVFAGLLNGLLGTGGGVPLYFALSRYGAEKNAYASASVGVLLLSLQTLFLYRGSALSIDSVSPFLPFLAVMGGVIGAFLLGKLKNNILRLIFAALLMLSGGYLMGKEIYLALS